MDIASMIFFLIVIVFSAIIHEYSHGWVANQMGDPTAKLAGRLTLNPVKHIDPIGSILIPVLLIPTGFLFAYAKPVPYNPYNLKEQRLGPLWVAIAGPLSNFILAAIFGLVMQLAPVPASMLSFLAIIVYANVLLGVFNLVPIPPLDGSKLLHVIWPEPRHPVRQILDRYGFLILLLFILFFFRLLSPVIFFLYSLFTGGSFLF
jgi:Zn-dependent protease